MERCGSSHSARVIIPIVVLVLWGVEAHMCKCCDPLSSYDDTVLPIGDFETFHYSSLRGNFASYLCGGGSRRVVVRHSLCATAWVASGRRKAVCYRD